LDRTLVTQILAGNPKLSVETAVDGADALQKVGLSPPALVLTDMVMPEPDGLELVRKLKQSHPSLPCILMTSQGSEEIAMEALRLGAASYIPKAAFGPELLETVEEVLALASERRFEEELHGRLVRKDCVHEFENEPRLLRPLVRQMQRSLSQLGWADEASCMQMSVALSEALQNAIEHGNLEVSSEARATSMADYEALMESRRTEAPFRDRRVRLSATLDRNEARFVIEDEGPGFDPASLPDPRNPANLERLSGRGVMLMRTFMDEVTFNERGNAVTLVKRRG
jgi:CheY-like chemotaxis protein